MQNHNSSSITRFVRITIVYQAALFLLAIMAYHYLPEEFVLIKNPNPDDLYKAIYTLRYVLGFAYIALYCSLWAPRKSLSWLFVVVYLFSTLCSKIINDAPPSFIVEVFSLLKHLGIGATIAALFMGNYFSIKSIESSRNA